MTTSTVSPEKRITVLKHLAGGKPSGVVATLVGMEEHDVVTLASSHGYPDRDKMSWAVDVLTENLEKDQRKHAERPLAGGGTVVESARPPAVRPAPDAAPAKPDEFRILINAAKQSPKKRIQALAERILDDTAKLRGLLERETEQDQIQRALEAEKARARAEVERLEHQLAEAKAKLRGKPASVKASTPGGTSPSAVIREWARGAGVDCPAVGRVPESVRAAYDAAHEQQAS